MSHDQGKGEDRVEEGRTTIGPGEVADYLRAAGVLPGDCPVVVEELAGGVSSAVLRAEDCERCLVLKQALPKLKVHDDWRSGVERALTEAHAATALAVLLPPGAVLPPLHIDPSRYLFVMACAPSGAETWKARLMRGDLDKATAARAGSVLGWIHGRSRGDAALAEAFADRQYFLSLRVAPYLHTTAERRPELADAVAGHEARMLATRECLVHGDYSPKNMLVNPSDPAEVILLDHEVAHWGDPAFDLAFCLTHLHLKALAFPERDAAYLDLARVLWEAYREAAVPSDPGALEANAVGLLGCIVAARVDGKSPVEYLTTDALKESARNLARTLLLDRVGSFAEARRATLWFVLNEGDE
ncbi:MAG: phosphotransferase family protein [Chloroflexota bacterium]